MLPLIESGVITNSRKRLHPGRMDVGEIMGTERLFRWVHDNPMVNMEPSDIVHDPQVVGALGDLMFSVNSALEVDLLGQVNAESVGRPADHGHRGAVRFRPRRLAGNGGTVHHRPALERDGRGKVSRIAARLPSGARVTTPRFIADYVVTEYGTAALGGHKPRREGSGSCPDRPPGVQRGLGAGADAYVLSLSISVKTSGSFGEPVRDLVVPDTLAVDIDEEDAARPFLEGGVDAVLGFDGGLQTGGLGEEVSLPAIRDQNVHAILLSLGRC